jgi:conjugative transfer signal peptidase TraF
MLARRRVAIASISAAAVAMLAVPISASSAQLVWNLTPSAPAGLYRIERGGWNVGDRVAVLPSQDLAADLDERGVLRIGKLLIKRVAAAAGDKVCRQHDEVSVNGRVVAMAKVSGSDGAQLPFWHGCATLSDAQVFLLGDTANSYDGRYFGVTSASDVVGRAVILASP